MRVADLLRSKGGTVVTITPESSVDAAVRLLIDQRVGGLPVVSPGRPPAGFLAERDIVQALSIAGNAIGELQVERIMQRPAPTCAVEDSIHEVMSRMTRSRLRHLIVLDGERLVGVLSVGDLVKNRLEQLEVEAGVLRDYVAAQRAST